MTTRRPLARTSPAIAAGAGSPSSSIIASWGRGKCAHWPRANRSRPAAICPNFRVQQSVGPTSTHSQNVAAGGRVLVIPGVDGDATMLTKVAPWLFRGLRVLTFDHRLETMERRRRGSGRARAGRSGFGRRRRHTCASVWRVIWWNGCPHACASPSGSGARADSVVRVRLVPDDVCLPC